MSSPITRGLLINQGLCDRLDHRLDLIAGVLRARRYGGLTLRITNKRAQAIIALGDRLKVHRNRLIASRRELMMISRSALTACQVAW